MAKEWPARIKKCEYCGNEFVYRTSVSRFCSASCRSKWGNKERAEREKAERKADREKLQEQEQKEQERAKRDKNSLQKKINAARALGMTYGKYVAMTERGAK